MVNMCYAFQKSGAETIQRGSSAPSARQLADHTNATRPTTPRHARKQAERFVPVPARTAHKSTLLQLSFTGFNPNSCLVARTV